MHIICGVCSILLSEYSTISYKNFSSHFTSIAVEFCSLSWLLIIPTYLGKYDNFPYYYAFI